jgi:hypothetical protein
MLQLGCKCAILSIACLMNVDECLPPSLVCLICVVGWLVGVFLTNHTNVCPFRASQVKPPEVVSSSVICTRGMWIQAMRRAVGARIVIAWARTRVVSEATAHPCSAPRGLLSPTPTQAIHVCKSVWTLRRCAFMCVCVCVCMRVCFSCTPATCIAACLLVWRCCCLPSPHEIYG